MAAQTAMNQWPQFLGAFLLLAAYALAQSGRLNAVVLNACR